VQTTIDNVPFTDLESVTETIGTAVTVSGNVADSLGTVLSGVNVGLNSSQGSGGSGTTDTNGNYSAGVLAGTTVTANLQGSDTPTGYAATEIGLYGQTAFKVSAPTTVNFVVPVARVAMRVDDSSGNPVPGVGVSINANQGSVNLGSSGEYTPDGMTDSSATTGANGVADLTALVGASYTVGLTPPEGSTSYLQTSITNAKFTDLEPVTVVITSTAPALMSIAVTPAKPVLTVGSTKQLTATGTFSNGSTQNITNSVKWASLNTAAVTANASGLAKAVDSGTAEITATSGSLSGSTIVTVTTPARAPSSLSLSSSRSPVPLGTKVTYTARVTPALSLGSVAFADNGTPIVSCPPVSIVKGLATCQVAYRAIGIHSITARYGGDPDYMPSPIATLRETVSPAADAASLFALPGATLTDDPVKLTVTVAPPASGLPTPTGTASFYEKTKLLARVALSAGEASYTVSFPLSGTEPLTAAFSGDTNYLASKSAVVNVIVTAPGYRLVGGDGGVFDYGSTPYKGGLHGKVLPAPIVGIANTNDAQGYWMVGNSGKVYPFGDAGNYGELSSAPASLVIGVAATVDSKGYWLAEAGGTVVAFGDAEKFPPVSKPTSPVVAIVADPQGGGYWLVTKDAKIYALGTAHLYGEANGEPPVAGSVAAMSALPDANGYWLLSSAGTVYAFGAAKNFTFTGGNKPPSGSSFVGIAAFPDGDGYWLVTSTGYVEGFGSARYLGDEHTAKLTKPIFGISAYP
jgi:hypothetical protein